MKVKEVFEKSVQFFREKQIENPRLETELLLASVLKTDRIGIYLKYDAPLQEEEITSLRNLVIRKSKGEPTAYLIGEKFFFGHRFEVGPGVLIPRPETELIVEEVIQFVNQLNSENLSEPREELNTAEISPLRIADLGSGSGCLGLSLGLQIPQAQVTLIERSSQAYRYIQKNLEALIDKEEKTRFHLENKAVEEWTPSHLFDVIVANPPYIDEQDQEVALTVRQYEPAEALFASESGLAMIASWLQFVVDYLRPGGVSYFEIGHKQGSRVKELFISQNIFSSVEVIQDFNQKDRVIKAVKNG